MHLPPNKIVNYNGAEEENYQFDGLEIWYKCLYCRRIFKTLQERYDHKQKHEIPDNTNEYDDFTPFIPPVISPNKRAIKNKKQESQQPKRPRLTQRDSPEKSEDNKRETETAIQKFKGRRLKFKRLDKKEIKIEIQRLTSKEICDATNNSSRRELTLPQPIQHFLTIQLKLKKLSKEQVEAAKNKSFICSYCGFTYSIRSAFVEHENGHRLERDEILEDASIPAVPAVLNINVPTVPLLNSKIEQKVIKPPQDYKTPASTIKFIQSLYCSDPDKSRKLNATFKSIPKTLTQSVNGLNGTNDNDNSSSSKKLVTISKASDVKFTINVNGVVASSSIKKTTSTELQTRVQLKCNGLMSKLIDTTCNKLCN